MYRGFSILFTVILLASSAVGALAIPTPYGNTGLLTQPTAETLAAGNICVGIWADHAELADESATILPTAITLGLGTFLEAYGSYPNLLANGEESDSGRGFANLGLKMKVFGGRSAPFKLAIDGQLRKSVSDDPALDGLNSVSTRLIASLKSRRFGIHANGGYIANENPTALAGGFNDQYVVGGGIELYPTKRIRVIAEAESQSKLIDSMEDSREAIFGLQYFISPHLTLNLGAGIGLTNASPDYRGLVGFSTCQGIGTYQKPIPTIAAPEEESLAEEKKEPVKVIKVRTLTPLATRTAPKPIEPVGQFEIPVESPSEEVVLPPGERLLVPGTDRLLAAPIVPVQPLMAVAPIATAAPSAPATVAAVDTVAVEPVAVTTPAPVVAAPVVAAPVVAAPVVAAPVVAAPVVATSTPVVASPPPAIVDPVTVAVVEPVTAPAPVVQGAPATSEPMVVTVVAPAVAAPVAPAEMAQVETDIVGVPFEAISPLETVATETPTPGLEIITIPAPEVAPRAAVQETPAVADQPVEAIVYRKFRLQEVTFGTNQWKISQEGIAALTVVAEQLRKENKQFLLRVDGHTDSVGSNGYNDKLSLQRSITIATSMVVHNGFDPARMFVKGFGEGKPIADNNTEEGKSRNRRVEILVLLPKKVPAE